MRIIYFETKVSFITGDDKKIIFKLWLPRDNLISDSTGSFVKIDGRIRYAALFGTFILRKLATAIRNNLIASFQHSLNSKGYYYM